MSISEKTKFGYFNSVAHVGTTFDTYQVRKPTGRELNAKEREPFIKRSVWFKLYKKFLPDVQVRSYKSTFGTTPTTFCHMWNLIKLFEADPTKRTLDIKEKYPKACARDLLMLAESFRTNDTEDQCHARWKIKSPKTYRQKIKYITMILASRNLCDNEYILSIDPAVREAQPPFNVAQFAGFVDGIECLVTKFVDFHMNRALYSGYKKQSTLKYLLFCSFGRGYLMNWEGNWGGPTPDNVCMSKCKACRLWLKNKNLELCGDSKFSSLHRIWTPFEFRGPSERDAQKQLCSRRSVIEHVVGQVGKYLILGSHFRGNKKNHIKVFTIVANFVYCQLLESPLRDEKKDMDDMIDED